MTFKNSERFIKYLLYVHNRSARDDEGMDVG